MTIQLERLKFRKFCAFCKGQNYDVDVTTEKTDICEQCMKQIIETNLKALKNG